MAFEVRDLDEALEWWARWFAFELRGRRGRWRGSTSATSSWRSARSAAGGSGAADAARHVGLVVEDKEALRDALREAGEDVRRLGLAARP